jgi:hypothetical protein
MRVQPLARNAALVAATMGLVGCVPRLNDDPPTSCTERPVSPAVAEAATGGQGPKPRPLGSGAAFERAVAPVPPHMGRSYGSPGSGWSVSDAATNVEAWLRERKVRHWGHERCWTSYAGLGWTNECSCQPIAVAAPSRVDLLACEWVRTPENLPGQSECFVVGRTILYAVAGDSLRLVLDVPTSTWAMDEGCDRYGPKGLWLSKQVDDGDVVFGEASSCNAALADFDSTSAEAPLVAEVRERRLARRAFTTVCKTIGRWRWRDGALVRTR